MLNRRIHVGTQGIQNRDPLEAYARDALSTSPTYAHSALQSFTQGVLTIPTLNADIQSTLLGKQTPQSIGLHETLSQIEGSLRNVDAIGQQGLDFTANLMGSVFSLVPIATEGAGKAFGSVVAEGIARFVPKALSRIGEKQILKLTLTGIEKETLGAMGTRGLKLAGGFAGFLAPESLEQSYNEETNQFNIGKAALNVGINGALGFGLASVPFLAGILGKRVFGLATKEERAALEKIASYDKAFEEKRINSTERKWLQEYHEKPNDLKVQNKATEILGKEGHSVDLAHNRALIDILSEEDAKNLASTTLEQLATEHPDLDQTALSDFIIHNSLDKKRGSSMVDGINGWIEHIDEQLSKKEANLSNVESKIIPLMEEEQIISNIRKGLFKQNGQIKNNFKSKPHYYQLDEMANTSTAARHLLDRVHLEEAHNTQKAYRNVLQAFNQLLSSNLAKYTQPERAAQFLKNKLEQTIDRPIGKEVTKGIEEEIKVPKSQEESAKSIEKLRSEVEQSDSILLKEDFEVSEQRFKQFEKSEGVLKNLIGCVMGALNGKE